MSKFSLKIAHWRIFTTSEIPQPFLFLHIRWKIIRDSSFQVAWTISVEVRGSKLLKMAKKLHEFDVVKKCI